MIIFINEENAYRSWVTHHRMGFIVDGHFPPKQRVPRIHRATCSEIRPVKTTSTRWTTHGHLKACSLDLGELVSWSKTDSGREPQFCQHCQPQDDSALPPDNEVSHVTKLGKALLDSVVEAAIVSLDRPGTPYSLTTPELADIVDKSPAQIAAALARLIQSGLLRLNQNDVSEDALASECIGVFPTARAMQTLPAFQDRDLDDIDSELKTLETPRD